MELRNSAKFQSYTVKKLIKSLGDTAELIDQTLTILKGHLARIISEIEAGNIPEAKRLISELQNQHDWESKYRQFQMCVTR